MRLDDLWPSAVNATKSAHRGSQSAVATYVQKPRFNAPVTKSELLDDHRHVQSAAPATKRAFRSKTPPIPCTCHEKSTLQHQSTRFPLHLSRKVTTMYQNAHGTTTRAQSPEAPAAGRQILRACAVEVHMDDVERHECTVNSSESAAHARAEQRSKHTCFSLTVRTPQCAHTVWRKTNKKNNEKNPPELCARQRYGLRVLKSMNVLDMKSSSHLIRFKPREVVAHHLLGVSPHDPGLGHKPQNGSRSPCKFKILTWLNT